MVKGVVNPALVRQFDPLRLGEEQSGYIKPLLSPASALNECSVHRNRLEGPIVTPLRHVGCPLLDTTCCTSLDYLLWHSTQSPIGASPAETHTCGCRERSSSGKARRSDSLMGHFSETKMMEPGQAGASLPSGTPSGAPTPPLTIGPGQPFPQLRCFRITATV